jgi:two-component system CheB/CheR fusion protein
MVLNKVPALRDYLDLLRGRPAELGALYEDLLIKVTHFFRDPEVFEAVKREALPALIKARRAEAGLRLWVPGCSTGEEAYSLAIVVAEALAEQGVRAPFQVFATDVSEAALEVARSGVYIENVSMDLSPERLRRFFVRAGDRWQIAQPIRERCVFARQDLTRDPPFSKLDLVSCRNVLLYLEPAMQKRVLGTLHYALNPSGYLVLGTSEVAGPAELFSVVDRKAKIYARQTPAVRPALDIDGLARRPSTMPPRPAPEAAAPPSARSVAEQVQNAADLLVMERYAPPGVLVDADLAIVQFRGRTGPYLEPAPGEASLDLLKMANKGMALELRAAVHEARRSDAPVRVEGLRLVSEGATVELGVEVVPIEAGGGNRWFLVLFHEQMPPRAGHDGGRPHTPGGRRRRVAEDARAARLERELLTTKEYLQVTLDEQEATNEELKAANEELLSSNEELQNINEELDAARQEQEAVSEELVTLNQELHGRNGDLDRLATDLHNLFASVDLPIVILGKDLTIRRFTPPAERLLHLGAGTVGRPLRDLDLHLDVPDLPRLAAEAVEGTASRAEAQDRGGRRYSLRVQPYRAADGRIDGAVVVLVDLDGARRRGDADPRSADGGPP